MPDLRMRLTDSRIHNLPFAASGQYLARDTEIPGFFVLVGKTTKTCTIQANLRGKSRRWSLGRSPEVKVEDARLKAIEMLARIRRGEDPSATGRGDKGPTLREAFVRFKAVKERNGRAERTIQGYADFVERVLKPIADIPLAELGREPAIVISEHDRVTRQHGPYAANGAARTGRAIYNHARKASPSLPALNPFAQVDWNPSHRRDTAMGPGDLPAWWAQVQALPNPIRQAFHVFTLLSGSRPGALTVARWRDVSVRQRVLHVPKPKGGAKKAFDIPLSRAMLRSLAYARLIGRRLYPRQSRTWIFPADSAAGHIVEYHENRKVLGKYGNDLRQTYRTLAQAAGLSDLDAHLLMNHSLPGVNAGYITKGKLVDHLRTQQELLSRYIVERADA